MAEPAYRRHDERLTGTAAYERVDNITDQLYNLMAMERQLDTLSATFGALADPTRRAILTRLSQGDASVKELAAPFDLSQPAISKHLRVLERAGLIEQGRQAQWRPRRLRAEPLRDVAEWVGQYRPHWEERFDRLDAFLRELQSGTDERTDERKGTDDDRDQD